MIDRLQVAQARRVRRRHVDDDEVDPLGQRLGAVLVVGGGVLFGGHLVLADVGTHDRAATGGRCAQLAQLVGCRVRSGVVEAHAVAQASLLHEAPQARRVIARLRAWRDGADLDEGVAERAHAEHGLRILVHTGCQAQARRQAALTQHEGDLDASDHPRGAVSRIEVAQRGSHEPTRRGESAGHGNRSQPPVVCILRIGMRDEVCESPVVRATDHAS